MASVNFLDIQQRRGDLVRQKFYSREGGVETSLPTSLGNQGVGVVEALGSGGSHVHIGERVAWVGVNGSYATHVVAPVARLIPIPDGMSFEQAAAGLVQGFLAYAFTHGAYPVKPGDWCLVQAAAGGMGLLIVQMAKLRGGKVIGVTSTEEKAQIAIDAGADTVIVSTHADIAREARHMTESRGVNVVYDGVGKDTFEADLDSLAPGGYLVLYGQSSGFVPPFDLMTLQDKGSLFLTRTNGLPYLNMFPQYLSQFVEWVRQGQLSIRIDRTYALAQVAQAHAAVEQRQTSGRVLLRVNEA
jgi:NADPH2:quinone reductase